MATRTYVSSLSSMSPAEKYIHQRTLDKLVKQRYYENKGRLQQMIRVRCKKYSLSVDYFNECKTADDVNQVVNTFLTNKGLPIQPTRQVDYKKQKSTRDVKLPTRLL